MNRNSSPGAPGQIAPRVLVLARRVFPDLLDPLRARWDLVEDVGGETGSLREQALTADALLADAAQPVDAELVANAPRLRVVSNIAVGHNNVDVAACTRAGVLVTNTPGVLTEATADHAFALLLAAARRVGESERWLRAGHWRGFALDSFLGADVHGATLGILGMGRIGAAIALRARGFSMQVLHHNRSGPRADSAAVSTWVEKDELLSRSDFVVLVVPYSAQTHHLLGAAEFARMKRGAILVNIARGGVIDDAALVRALREGPLAAAALDVMEGEPLVHPGLLAAENVVLTPHIGSATTTARRAMVSLALRNLESALAGERPPFLVNPEAWPGRCAAAPFRSLPPS